MKQLEYYDSVRGINYSDWRLPTIQPVNDVYNTNFSFNGTTDHGYGNKGTSSELRYMFYSNLKNTALCSPTDSTSANDCRRTRLLGLENAGPFKNLQAGTYWSGSDFKKEVWAFDFSVGYQGLKTASNKNNKLFAWAVRDGDVGNIKRESLTNSAWLFLFLAALFSLPFLFIPLPHRTQ